MLRKLHAGPDSPTPLVHRLCPIQFTLIQKPKALPLSRLRRLAIAPWVAFVTKSNSTFGSCL